MTSDFGKRVYPVIRYVISVLNLVRRRAPTTPRSDEVASRLKTLLSQFDVEGVRRNEFDLAKRALVYWIDEVLINSSWEDAAWWSDHTMERHFFDSRERAWRFFEKAAVARQLENPDALETFYLCACFGFQGTYRDRSTESTSQKQPGLSDTWTEIPVPGEPTQESSGVAAEESASREPAAASSDSGQDSTAWWEEDPQEEEQHPDARGSWNMGFGTVDLSRRELERIASGRPDQESAVDEPDTLQDWIESVYRQLAPAPPDPYSPLGEPQEPGEAAPLTGRLSRVWALMCVVMVGLFLTTLVVITLYRA